MVKELSSKMPFRLWLWLTEVGVLWSSVVFWFVKSHGKQANARLRDAMMHLEGLEKRQERGHHEAAIKVNHSWQLNSGSLVYKKDNESWYIGAYMVLSKVNFSPPSRRSGIKGMAHCATEISRWSATSRAHRPCSDQCHVRRRWSGRWERDRFW